MDETSETMGPGDETKMGATGAGTSPAGKGVPPWAWAVIGLLAGALVIGGVWFAYESGRGAGRAEGEGSKEATATEVAQVVERAESTETPPATADEGAAQGGGTSQQSSGGSSGGSGGGGQTGGGQTGGGQTGTLGKLQIQKPNIVPLLAWENVYQVATSGTSISSSNPPIKVTRSSVRVVVDVTGSDGKYLTAELLPAGGGAAVFLWGTDTVTPGMHAEGQSVKVTPGDYRLKMAAVDAGYTVKLQQR